MIGKKRKSNSLWTTLVVGLILVLPSGQLLASGEAAAKAELDSLAEELALLLKEPGFRGFLRSEIAQSRNREGIIELDKFLDRASKRPGAPPGLAKAGQTARSVSSKVKAARRSRLEGLDLYLPVGAHRAKWKGGEDFLIAAAPLDDEDNSRIVAFEVKTGNRVTLDPKRVPSQIVMVLAPEEHDTHDIPTRGGPDRDQRNVRPHVTGREPAEDPVEGEEGEGSYVGIRRILLGDVKENSWTRGAPEIFVNFGQRKGNYCTVKRVNLYSWDIFASSPQERKWYTTWPSASQGRCKDGETCWYFDSRASCCGSGYYWNRIFVDIREDDGGWQDRETIRTPYTGYSCSVKWDYGDDYVEHGYVWKSNFKYEYDYVQDVGNARFIWHKIH